MIIDIICSDSDHPVNAYLQDWAKAASRTHDCRIYTRARDIRGGDLLFAISCSEILSATDRQKYGHCFVIHASDLPKGRGWSPHIWQLLAGAETICLTLLEADDKVDSGKIWHKKWIDIPRHFLFEEINQVIFSAEIELMNKAIQAVSDGQCGEEQKGEPTYFEKRKPSDSMLDTKKPLVELINQIRVSDPVRCPAYFEYEGHVYRVIIDKIIEE